MACLSIMKVSSTAGLGVSSTSAQDFNRLVSIGSNIHVLVEDV